MSGATPSGLTSHYSIKKFADHADPEAWQLNDNYDVIDSKIYEATIADIYTSTSPIIKSIANVFSLNYSATNLRNNSNYLDTIQDIATTSSPLFTSLTLANNLTISNGLISLAKNSDGVFYGSVYSDTNWQNARILLQRARGTIASPTAVQNGDQLATFDLFAYAPSGSFQRTTGANGLTFLVDGVPSASTVPAKAIIGGLTIKASGNVISDGLITANSGIYSIGNVGIGTTASYPLDIQINSATDEVLLNISNTNGDNAARSANIQLGCGGYINTFLRQNGGSGTQTSGSALDTILMNTWASNYNGHLRFGTNNKIQMSVMHDGNVLIGYTSDPNIANRLSVSGSINSLYGSNGGYYINTNPILRQGHDGDGTNVNLSSVVSVGSKLTFNTGDSSSIERMRINNLGDVFIGYTSDPTSGNKLAVSGSSYFNGTLTLSSSSDLAVYNHGGITKAGYISQLSGYQISAAGAADFRYLYADEMHVKSFIADLEQALAGGQIICKSVAKVAQNFAIPGDHDDLIVEEFDGFVGQVFEDEDIIRLRQINRIAGGLNVADVWGTVSYVSSQHTTKPYTQTYTFIRSHSPNQGTASGSISSGSLALDYGKSGNGYYEVTAVDGISGSKSPYSQIVTWNTHPASTTSGQGLTVKARLGNLLGISDTSVGLNTLPVYGLYSSDAYLKGNMILGSANSASLTNGTIALGNIKGTAQSAIKIANTGVSASSGLFGYDGSGTEIFSIKLDNTAKIAGWNFDSTKIYQKGVNTLKTGNTGYIGISTTNSGSGNFYDGSQILKGFSFGTDNSVNTYMLTVGQMMSGRDIIKEGYYGIQMMDNSNTEYFALGMDTTGTGNAYNTIAGWNFDTQKIFKHGYDVLKPGYTGYIGISTTNSGSGNFYDGSQILKGFSFGSNTPSYALMLTVGQMMSGRDIIKEGYYGIQMMDNDNYDYFSLGMDLNGTGSAYNTIAGWNFNASSIYKGNVYLESTGTTGLRIASGSIDIIKIGDYSYNPITASYTNTVQNHFGSSTAITGSNINTSNGWFVSGSSYWHSGGSFVPTAEYHTPTYPSSSGHVMRLDPGSGLDGWNNTLTFTSKDKTKLLGKRTKFSFNVIFRNIEQDYRTSGGTFKVWANYYSGSTLIYQQDVLGTTTIPDQIISSPGYTVCKTGSNAIVVDLPNYYNATSVDFAFHYENMGGSISLDPIVMDLTDFTVSNYTNVYTYMNNSQLNVYNYDDNYFKVSEDGIDLHASNILIGGYSACRFLGIGLATSPITNVRIGDIYINNDSPTKHAFMCIAYSNTTGGAHTWTAIS